MGIPNGMDTDTRRAKALGAKLGVTVGKAQALKLEPRQVSALCTAQVGISSLGDAITPGCGSGKVLADMATELSRLAEIAG